MSQLAVPQPMTADEYLTLERSSPVKHEFVGGVLYLMAGGSRRHNLVAGRVAELVRAAGRSSGCRTYQADVKLELPGRVSYYYPDVMVVCAPAPTEHDDVERNPCLIVEILSPSTRGVDTREKRAVYTSLESLEAYVMVDPGNGVVEVIRRGPERRWVAAAYGLGDSFDLTCPDITLQVDALFIDAPIEV